MNINRRSFLAAGALSASAFALDTQADPLAPDNGLIINGLIIAKEPRVSAK